MVSWRTAGLAAGNDSGTGLDPGGAGLIRIGHALIGG
jgi:hypothetical protein